jgi:hypothetical protein
MDYLKSMHSSKKNLLLIILILIKVHRKKSGDSPKNYDRMINDDSQTLGALSFLD